MEGLFQLTAAAGFVKFLVGMKVARGVPGLCGGYVCLRLGRGGFYLRAHDRRFGAEPIIEVVAVLAAALLVELMREAADFFFKVRLQFTSYVCGWFLGRIFWHGRLLGGLTNPGRNGFIRGSGPMLISYSQKVRLLESGVNCSRLVQSPMHLLVCKCQRSPNRSS